MDKSIEQKRDYKIKTKNELDFEKTHGVGYRKFLRWLKKEHLMGLGDLSKGRVSFFTKEFRDYLKTKQRRKRVQPKAQQNFGSIKRIAD